MRKRFRRTAVITKRVLSLMVALTIVISLFTVASIVSAETNSTYYLDISNNSDWKPSSGEKLCATFTTSGGAQTGSVQEFTEIVTGKIYKVTDVPSNAANIQLYLVRNGSTIISNTPAKGTYRVFYNNTKANWDNPYVYSWTGDGTTDDTRNHAWPGLAMTRIGSSKYWYYDAPFENVIFNNGKDGNQNVQTEDLKVEGKNPVFSSATGSTWDSAPYYKKYAEASFSTAVNASNEMYMQKNDTVKISKYPYDESTNDSVPRTYTNKQTIYLYNPDWTDASKVKVTWDYNDPYQTTITMEKLTDANKPAGVFDGKVPAGFYVAQVPNDAKIQFSYNLATSNITKVPTGQDNMCYNLKNSANVWCNLKDALGEVTDFLVPIESGSSNNSNDGTTFWTDAVYYDYLSDNELQNTDWLKPARAGTKPADPGNNNYDGAIDDWFEFYNFNKAISAEAEANKSSWKYPLYFGNFCANWDAFLKNENRDSSTPALGRGYFGPNATGLTNFDYIVNNSNGLKPNANQYTSSNHIGVQGLAYSTSASGSSSLNDDGNIQYAAGKAMPYFDSAWLKTHKYANTKSLGKTLRSSFPFYKKTENGVTTYKFDSSPTDGTPSDNVFFNWTGDHPDSVGYGRGSQYEVADGLRNFMGNVDAGHGIFPFNNTAKTKGNRLDTTEANNLDYGFGVKINMDFRVPAGGKLPNGQDVKFEYSGDDDLWVYISEYGDDGKLKNSRLALDLGGNHKQAKGEINFNTMKSKAESVVELKESNTYKRDTIYIQDNGSPGDNDTPWGSVAVYAWNSDTDNGWFTPTKNGNIYSLKADATDDNGKRFDYYTMFTLVRAKNDWYKRAGGNYWDGTNDHSTVDGNRSGRDTIANHWGKLTYTNNINYITQDSADALYKYTNNKVTNFGFTPKRDTTYEQLDPTKTYHLTVFYMERGMIESNAMMKFTMTPALNDLKVKKTVDTTDVNHGLEQALKDQKFEFTNKENGELRTTSRYTLNNESSTKNVDNQTGVYELSDGDVADFNNQFTTGSNIVVSEKNKTTGVTYATKWQVVDNANGSIVKPLTTQYGQGRDTDSFELKDSTVDTNNAKLQVNVVNTPSVKKLTLSKKVRNEGDTADVETDKEFRFRIKVDVDGNGTYKPYGVGYKVISGNDTTSLNADETTGEFRFSAKDTVEIDGLPVGAKYKIEEVPTPGYAPLRVMVDNGRDDDFTGSMEGAIGDSDSTVAFTNREKPISTTLKAKKVITDGTSETNYTSSGTNNELFSFTAKGLGETVLGAITTIDVSNTENKTIQAVNNGEVVFANKGGTDNFLNFTQVGTYLYSIVENRIVVDNNKTSESSLKTYKDDIGVDTQKYLAKVVVSLENSELIVNNGDITYYKWDGGTITEATFADTNKVTEVKFKNPIQKHGKVTIIKNDSIGKLDGAEFTLYKVGAENEAITANTEVVETKLTSDGKAEFNNLDIYEKTNGNYTGLMNYQWYAVKETTAKEGYFREPTIHYFKLPVLDGNDVKYDIEFTYVNGALVSPSSGSFMSFVIPIGITLVILSIMGIGVYVIRTRRRPLKHARSRVALKH